MKKISTLKTVNKTFITALIFVFSIFASSTLLSQTTTVNLGSGTATNSSNLPGPLNIYYRSLHTQFIYTKAEINAGGFNSIGDVKQFGFYVTGAPAYSLPNYTIKMKNTSASDATTHDGVGLQTVYTTANYSPTVGGYDMLTLTTPFAWDGNSNILVDVCFDPVSGFNSSTGIVRTYSGTTHFIRDQFTTMCGVATTGLMGFKPQARMEIEQNCTPLSGPYTIGPSGDFLNFSYAVNTMDICGISGPVTFNVASGTYTEQINFASISGLSSTNTITFQSASGDSTDVNLTYAPTTSTTNWTVRLNGVSHITFKNLTLSSTGVTYGRVVEFINGADTNVFTNNQIIAPVGTSSSFAGFYSYTGYSNDNLIQNNRIVNGYYGMYIRGQSTTNLASGWRILNNIFEDQYTYGIYTYYLDAPVISGNTINATTSYTSFYGIFSGYSMNNTQITKNQISYSSTTGYCIYLNGCNNGTHTNDALIANNFISQNTNITRYGIYQTNCQDINYYHNSINIIGLATSSRCIYMTGATTSGIEIKNNILSNKANGYAIYSNVATTAYTSDYNNLYTTGNNIGYQGGNRTNLSAWQTSSLGDANSVSVSPGFYTDYDLHTGNINLNNIGTPIAAITDDIDGESRNATTPDIGADEFIPSPIDVGAYQLVYPASDVCYSSAEVVTIQVKNYGTVAVNLSVNPLTVNVSVSGTNPTTFSPLTLNTGTIAIGGTIDVTVSSNYNMMTNGTYTFNASTSMPADGNPSNDAMTPVDRISNIITTLPAEETFESFTAGNGSTGNPGILNNGWTRFASANYEWLVKSGGTTSTNTGPLADHTLGTSLGIYVYAEGSGGGTGNVCELLSPCVDLTSFTNPRLKFWYHMYGATIGSLHIDIYNGSSWTNSVYSLIGQQQTYQAASWQEAIIDISSFAGNIIKVRFRAIRGTNYTSDIAIDDAYITEYPNVNLGNDTSFCQGGSITLDAGGTSGYTYQWREISSPAIIGTNQTYTVTQTGYYIVEVTNQYGGNDADSIDVFVSQLPVVEAGPNASVCGNGTHTISGASALYNLGYAWTSTGTGSFTNSNTFTPTYSPSNGDIISGSVKIYLTATALPPCANVADSMTLTIHPLPTVTFSGLAAGYCVSDPTVTLTGSPSGGTFSGSGISGNIFNPTTAGVGTHTITYSYTDAFGCSNSSNQSVQVNGIPNVTFSGLSTSYCINSTSSTLSGNPSGGTFSGTGISGNTFNPSTAGVGTHTITYQYADAFGCTNMTTQNTTVNPLPTVSFSGLAATYCANAPSVTLTGSPSGGTFSGTGISGNTFNPVSAGSGTHSITYSYTNVNGCTNTANQSVTVFPLPTVSFSGLAAGYCITDPSVTLSGSPNGGSFSGSGISGNTFSPSSAGAGNHTITYNYTDGNGCSNIATQNVTINNIPTVNFSGLATSYCINDASATLSGNPAGGTFSGTGISGNTFNPTTAGVGTYSITYTYSDAYGCTNSNIKSVTVNGLPTVSFSGLNSSYCQNATTVALTGNPSGGTFSGSGISGNSFNPVTAGVGTHSITYSYTNTNGCTNNTSQNVTINSLPTVTINGLSSSFCINDASVSLSGSPTGGSFSGTGVSGNSFNPTTAGAGTHTITYSYTDANGCSNDATQAVTVHNLPVVSITNLNSSYCVNATPITLSGNPSGGTFNGTGVSGGVFTPANAGTGSHTITYNYTDGNGCSNLATQNVTINGLPTVSFSGLNSSYCVNAASATLNGSPAGGTFSGTGISGNTFNPAVAGAGTFTITYTATDGNGCSNTAVQSVTVNSLPTVTINGLSSDFCINDAAASLNGNPSGGTFSGTGVSGGSFNPSTAGAGTHTISYSYTDANGCSNNATQAVTVHNLPTVSITNLNSTYCINATPLALLGNPSGGTFSGSGVSGGVFTAANAGAGNHTITYNYTDVNGCSGSATQNVSVISLPFISFSGLLPFYCADGASSTLTGNPNGGTFSGNGISGNTFNPLTAGSGAHIITYTYTDGNGCTNSITQNTFVSAPPTASFSGLLSAYCIDGDSSLLIGSPTGGTFSGNGLIGNTFYPSVAGVGTHIISYLYTDANGCSNTATQSVTVNALPNVSFTGLQPAYCENDPAVTLTGIPSGGTFTGPGITGNSFSPALAGSSSSFVDVGTGTITNSGTSYPTPYGNWYYGNKNHFLVLASELAALGVSAGPIQSLAFNVANVNNCPGLVNFEIKLGTTTSSALTSTWLTGLNTVYTNSSYQPILGWNTYIFQTPFIWNGSSNIVVETCFNNTSYPSNGNASVYQSTTSFASTHEYHTDNMNVCTSPGSGMVYNQRPNMKFYAKTGTGIHDIIYTYTDGNTCTSADTQTVLVYPVPVVTFTGLAPTYCTNGTSTTLTGIPAGGTFSGTGIVGNTFYPTIAGPGTFNITYTYTDGNSCSNSAVQSVTVSSGPTVSFNGLASSYCVNSPSVTMTGSPGGGTFTGPGVSFSTFNPSIAGVGTHNIIYSYYDVLSGCTGISEQPVTVNDLPVLTISGFSSPAEYCVNDAAITVSVNPSGGTLSGNGISGNQFVPSSAGPGVHTVTYTYTDANSCTNTQSINVTVYSLPNVTLTPFANVCADAPSLTLSGGLPWGGTYSGNGVSGGSFNPTTAGVGTHLITYSYSNANGCIGSATQNITVNAIPSPTIVGLASSYCENSPAIILVGNPTGGTFSGTGVSGGSFSPSISGPGNYNITYTITDANSCTGNSSQSVVVNALPNVSFTGLAPIYCQDTNDVILTGIPNGGTFSGNGINGNLFNPFNAGVGTHIITYTYTDANSCTNSSTQSVTVSPGPTVSFSGLSSSYCLNSTAAVLIGNPSGGAFSGPGISGNTFNPTIAGVGTHTIVYIFTDATGCTGSSNQSVVVNSLPSLSISGLNPGYCVNSSMVSLIGNPSGGTFSGNGVIGNTFNPAAAGVGTHIITYTYTNANSCTNTINQNVTINNLPNVSFSGLAPSYCADATSSILTGIPAGGTFSGIGISGNTFNPAIAGTGTHNITYTYSDGFGCSNASTQSTTVNALPTVSFSGLSPSYCSDTSGVSLFGSPGGGTFSGTGIIGNTFNPNIAGTGFHTITYSFTDINGCSNSTTQQTLVNAAPIANAGNDTTVTYGATIQLKGSASGGSSNYTYFWTGTMSVSNPNTAKPFVTNITSTSVFLLFVYDNTSGCYDTSSVTITVGTGGALSVNPTTLTPAVCAGSSVDLLSLASGGTGNYTYLWSSNPTGFTSTLANPTATPTVTTTYTVTVSDGSPSGNVTGSVTITVDPIPVVTISGLQSSYCLNSSPVTMTGSPAGGTFTGSGVSGNIFDPSVAGLGNHSVMYTYTSPGSAGNPFGCTNNYTIAVTVNTLPNVTFSGLASSYCADVTSVTLTGSPTGGTFSGNGISGNTFNPSLAGAGTHIITYSYSAGSGCSNSTTQSVVVNALPNVTISGLASSYCANSSVVTMTGVPMGGTFAGPGVIGNTFDPSLAGAGTHTVTYTYTDGNSCTTAAGQTVTINPLPPVSFSGLAASYCLNSTAVTLLGSPSGGTFSGNGISGNSFNPTIAGLGTHNITYTFTDAFGCSNSDMQSVNVDNLPTVTILGLSSVYCVNSGLVTLTGSPAGGTFSGTGVSGNMFNPSVAGQGNHSITYSYNDGNGCSNSTSQVVTVNPLPNVSIIGLAPNYCLNDPSIPINGSPTGGTFSGNGISGNSFTPSTAGAGMHIITYTYTDLNGCSNNTTQNVVVDALPNVSFTGLATSYCKDSVYIILTGNPAGGVFSGNGIVGNTFNPLFAGSGSHAITYSFTGTNGCSNTSVQNTLVHNNPIANAGIDFTILGGSTTLNGSATGSNLAYSWTPSSLLINPNIPNPTTVTITTTTVFTLTVTDTVTGCQGSDDMQLTFGGGPLSVNATANPMVICSGNTTQLDALGSGGSTMYTYSWSSNPTGFSSTLKNPVVSPTTTTIYTVTISDGSPSTSTSNVTITVNPSPNVIFTAIQPQCFSNSPLTLSGLGTPLGGTYSGTGVSGNSFYPSAAGAGSHTIIYEYQSLTNGCSSSASTIAIVLQDPTVSFSGLNTTYCDNATAATLTGLPNGGIFSGPGVVGNTFNPSIAGVGNHNITYSYTDANNCSGTEVQTVTVIASPTVSFSGLTPTYCENDAAVQLTGFPTGGTFSGPGISGLNFDPIVAGAGTHNIVYSYQNANGCLGSFSQSVVVNQMPVVTISGLASQYCVNSPTVSLTGSPFGGSFSGAGITANIFDPSVAGAGTHNIEYFYSDANACSNTAIQTIIVNLLPLANAGSDVTVPCGGPGLQIGSAAIAGLSYSWTPTTALSNATISNPYASPNLTTVYTVEVTDINTGCVSSDDVIVYVSGGPTAVASNDTIICGGNPVTLNVSGGTSYIWSNSATTSSITVNPLVTTMYVVTATMGGCSDADTVIVTVSYPNVDLGPDVSFCEGNSITLDAGVGYYSYYWNDGSMNQNLPVASSGSYWVSVTDVMGCANIDTINVNIHPLPIVNLGADTSINVKYSITLDAGPSFDAYLWSDFSSFQTMTVYGPQLGT
ncbi:MAG: hypothetical protein K9J13_07025, partial [Saprospiraceae bacterium]|nr:hypothetical protein [Saprospiraceae bacterium]